MKLLCALVLISASLSAQTAPRLIGLTSGTGVGSTVSRQVLCDPPSTACRLAIAISSDLAGGAAHDARTSALWLTTGAQLRRLPTGSCRADCTVPARITLGATAVASGLAVAEPFGRLIQLETTVGAARLHQWDITSCPPQPVARCEMQLPSVRHSAGGVAFDPVESLLFVATSVFSPQVANPSNTILVSRLSDPCTPICRISAALCGRQTLGPIRALAFDSCSRTLLASDGKQTAALRGTGVCDFRAVGCCPASPNNLPWVGLSVESPRPAAVGSSCLHRSCPACSSLSLGAVGAPAIGNPTFGLRIENGPTGALGFVLFNIARCVPQQVPSLCGPIYPLLAPAGVAIGLGPLSGSGTCDGTALLNAPIPPDPSLCGGALCFQGLAVCSGGLALTNGVQIVVGS